MMDMYTDNGVHTVSEPFSPSTNVQVEILAKPIAYIPTKARHTLRILMIATEAPPIRGGIARTVGYLRDGFQELGHQVDILAYPEVGRLVLGEIRLSSLFFKLPQLLYQINKYDVIHIHGATPTISDIALLFARFYAPESLIIYTHHMDLAFKWGSVFTKIYNHLHHRLCTVLANAVIASTHDNLKLFGGSPQGRVIPLPINLEHFSIKGQKDEQFTILFIGQFRPYKGVRVLLQALSQVKNVRLLLAGQGPEEHIYRSLAEELGLDIEFHIGVDDDQLRNLYRRAHTIVLPSISHAEAFGIVLVEGMAAGCIPIASDLLGVREVVGQTGFLFPKGEAEYLARILCSLRDDLALVQRLSDHARSRATEFGREKSINAYEQLITGLIAYRDVNKRAYLA